MGKRRAERQRWGQRHWMVALSLLTVVFLAVVVVLKVVVDRDEAPFPSSSPTTAAPSTPTSPSASPSSSPSVTSTPAPSTKAPSPTPDLATVEPAPARRVVVGDLVDAGFDASVSPVDGHLVPRSLDEVARWEDRGLPGNPAADTVVLVGAVRDGGALARLAEVGTGDRVVLRTDEGTLTYTTRQVTRRPSADQVDDPLLATRKPGRLVLVGATYDGSGDRQEQDVVVVAELTDVA